MKFIAHRGYSQKYKENSSKAFQKALEHNINMIEADIRLSKDKQWVVTHDPTLFRLTHIDKWVDQVKSNTLKKFGIISLANLLHIINDKIELNLDIKGSPNLDDLRQLFYILYTSGYQIKKFYLSSSDFQVVEKMITLRMTDPQLSNLKRENNFKIGIIGYPHTIKKKNIKKYLDFISMYNDNLDLSYYLQLRKDTNALIFVYTVNDKSGFKYFQEMGVDGIMSDDCTLFDKFASAR